MQLLGADMEINFHFDSNACPSRNDGPCPQTLNESILVGSGGG